MDKIKTEAFSLTANVKRVTTGLKNSISVFPGGSVLKNPPANSGDTRFNPWVRKIPRRRAWQSTPVFLPGESHRQRSLEVYRGCKELDTAEVTDHAHTYTLYT